MASDPIDDETGEDLGPIDSIAALRDRHRQIFEHRAAAGIGQFYAALQPAIDNYEARIAALAGGHRLLEIGSGAGCTHPRLAGRAASIVAIDVSFDAAEAAAWAKNRAGANNVSICIAAAEFLPFRPSSFDLVFGAGVLHQAGDSAVEEVAQTLSPDGCAIFLEPLGDNPLINWYRNRTPHLRMETDRPLRERDIDALRRHFQEVEMVNFSLLAIAGAPFRAWPGGRAMLRFLHGADRLLFRLMPRMAKFAWLTVLVMHSPKCPQV